MTVTETGTSNVQMQHFYCFEIFSFFKRFVKLLQLYLLRWISPPYPTHSRWFTFTDSQSDVTRSVQHSAAIEISNLSSATWWFPKVWFGTVC